MGANRSPGLSRRCTADVPANVTVKVDPAEGGMCVSLDTPEASIARSGLGLGPILLGGIAIGAAAVLIIGLHDDDHPVSH